MAASLTLVDRLQARLRWAGRPVARGLAAAVGLQTYEPSFEHLELLDRHTEYVEDARQIRDRRPTTAVGPLGRDLTITTEGLEDMLGGEFRGARILEVGPKYGIHSRWLDRVLAPAELVLCDLPPERQLHEEWRGELQSPARFVYADLMEADRLGELEPFELVLFLGVLYHTVHHVPMLAALNRATRLGGRMLLETSFDPRPDASVWMRWQPRNSKAKAVPTIDAVRLMLAWTGWRNVRRFSGYRPGSAEAVFLCEKTDELVEGSDFAPVVSPHRLARLGVAVPLALVSIAQLIDALTPLSLGLA